MRQRRRLDIADEFLHSWRLNLRDTAATQAAVVELLSRLEERAGLGAPVEPRSDYWVIKSDPAVVGGEKVPAIRIVYVFEEPDLVIAFDISYCDQPLPSTDGDVTLPLHHN